MSRGPRKQPPGGGPSAVLRACTVGVCTLIAWLMAGYVLFRTGHLSYFCGIDLVGVLYLFAGPGAVATGVLLGQRFGGRALPADRATFALLSPIAIGLAVCGGFEPGLVVYPAPERVEAFRYPAGAVLWFAGLMLVELWLAGQALARCTHFKLLELGVCLPASFAATALSMHAPGYIWAHALFLLVLAAVLAIGLALELAGPRRALLSVACVLFVATACERHDSVVLTAAQASKVAGLGANPPVPGPYWTLDPATVTAIDERLHGLLAAHSSVRCKAVANHLGDYVVQYAGFTDVDGARRVFVNGFDTRRVSAERAREALVFAGGGGSHHWQAVYDPATGALTACRINDVR